MFSKAFKLKSSTPLKSSVRKTLVAKLLQTYPYLVEDDLKEIIPPKANLTVIKITTHPGSIYIADNVPCIIEIEEIFYPTIYTLWRCPRMIPTIVIENHLAEKLQGGIIHLRRSHLPPFGARLPRFSKGAALSVCTIDNKAPVLVGIASYSSDEMLIVQTGICVRTINIIGDQLCLNEKFTKLNRPDLGSPLALPEINTLTENLNKMKLEPGESEILSKQEIENNDNKNCDEIMVDINEADETELSICNESDVTIDGFPDDMDGLLKYCLLCFIKEHGKKISLPLKTNLLYANHMISYCPPNKILDVKKSSYKKMGKFLEAMQKEGLIQIKEVEKGVDAVIAVNMGHELVKQHHIIECAPVENQDTNAMQYNPPSVRETYRITAAVAPLFASSAWKKGQTVASADVRNYLVQYVKNNNLQDADHKNLVKIDPYLGQFSSFPISISWDQLMSAVLSKMTNCTEITFPNGTVKTVNGKLALITMQIAKRSGNKKVTIVSNLEEYGINLQTLSKECQHGVAASCNITRTAGSKTDQLQIQGDQTYFLTKHLIEAYGLPKKYIEGADKYLSKKKN